MRALLFLASISLATTLALGGCGYNTPDLLSPEALRTDAKNALNSAESDVINGASAIATTALAPPPVNTTPTTLSQLAATNHLSPSQVAQLQSILNQGTANDKQNGLTSQQQAQNTQRRIVIIAIILRQQGPVAGQ